MHTRRDPALDAAGSQRQVIDAIVLNDVVSCLVSRSSTAFGMLPASRRLDDAGPDPLRFVAPAHSRLWQTARLDLEIKDKSWHDDYGVHVGGNYYPRTRWTRSDRGDEQALMLKDLARETFTVHWA